MRTVEIIPGTSLRVAAARIVAAAPACAVFCGIPIRARYATTRPEDIVKQYEWNDDIRRIRSRDVFQNGEPIVALDARANAAETWVKSVAAASGQRVHWHYSGGIAQVLFLGDRAKVSGAISALAALLNGRILRWLDEGCALYRGGCDALPDDVIAVNVAGSL